MYLGIYNRSCLLLSPACHKEHGKCVEGKGANFCLCNTGWKGETCDDCCPYWNCPEKNETIGKNVF